MPTWSHILPGFSFVVTCTQGAFSAAPARPAHAEQLPRQLMPLCAAGTPVGRKAPHLVLWRGDQVVELVCLALELKLDAIKAGEDGVAHACAPPASSAQRALQRVRLASTPAAGTVLTGGAQPVYAALGVHQAHHLLPR